MQFYRDVLWLPQLLREFERTVLGWIDLEREILRDFLIDTESFRAARRPD